MNLPRTYCPANLFSRTCTTAISVSPLSTVLSFMKRHLILLGISILLLACNEQTLRKKGFAVHGIDVSHYQKHIDWRLVASQDIRFAFIKATEGETFQDTLFCNNWEEIKQAGIKRGAYHFFRPKVPAETQARNFIHWVDMENGDLPPVLDVEVTDLVSPEILRQGVYTWLKLVEAATGIKPILYSNQKFFNKYLAGYFPEHIVWIARYSSWRDPCLRKNQDWGFWQYGNRGKIAGIGNHVDFNVFSGNFGELEKLCFYKPSPAAEVSAPNAEPFTSNP